MLHSSARKASFLLPILGMFLYLASDVYATGDIQTFLNDAGMFDQSRKPNQIETLDAEPGRLVPEPLPAESHSHDVTDSLSNFFHHDTKNTSNTHGKMKWVLRESPGNFNDPMRLFNHFKTKQNEKGGTAESILGKFSANTSVYQSEENVDNSEQNMAARVVYGTSNSWQLGSSYTLRQSVPDYFDETRNTEQAVAFDLKIPITDSFIFLTEGIGTETAENYTDIGYLIRAESNLGKLRLSGGYINLGEDFSAPFSGPLHGVVSDAEGFEASVDYLHAKPFWLFENITASLQFFSLSQHSNEEAVKEIDGSLHFSLSERDTAFFSLFNRADVFDTSTTSKGGFSHKWNDIYSSKLQINFAETDTSNTFRASADTSYKEENRSIRLALKWMKRVIDNSCFPPYQETKLRLDLKNQFLAMQVQGKYSKNSEYRGINLFGRLDYKPVFLHRNNITTYVSVGSSSASLFEERIELGLEFQF